MLQVESNMNFGMVLIVDDEPVVRSLMVRIFKRYGVATLTAEDGLHSLEVFREHESEIALVILDMNMPGLNGVETLHALRAMRDDLPIILSSGYDEHSLGDVQANECTSFVRKPYKPSDLWQVASHWLKPTIQT